MTKIKEAVDNHKKLRKIPYGNNRCTQWSSG